MVNAVVACALAIRVGLGAKIAEVIIAVATFVVVVAWNREGLVNKPAPGFLIAVGVAKVGTGHKIGIVAKGQDVGIAASVSQLALDQFCGLFGSGVTRRPKKTLRNIAGSHQLPRRRGVALQDRRCGAAAVAAATGGYRRADKRGQQTESG